MSTAPANTVAVVEDDEAMGQAIRRLLRTEGFEPELFGTAEEFLASGAVSRAGCLVLDIRLPGMSGVELYRHLHARGHALPTIFITARDDTRERGLTLKQTDCLLTKPFLGEALVEAVSRSVVR